MDKHTKIMVLKEVVDKLIAAQEAAYGHGVSWIGLNMAVRIVYNQLEASQKEFSDELDDMEEALSA